MQNVRDIAVNVGTIENSEILYFENIEVLRIYKFIFANKNTKKYMKELKLKIQSDLTKKYYISLQLLLMLTKI